MSLSLLAPLLFLATAAPAATEGTARWTADAGASRLVVHAFRSGLLRAFAHDHHFVPARWRAAATFDPERLEDVRGEVVVDTASLHDAQEALSPSDRAKVDRQVAGEVLDSGRFPEIRYEVTGFRRDAAGDGERVRGALEGRLSLHGATRPLAIPVEVSRDADGRVRVKGRGRFGRSDFGVEVPSVAFGAVSVKNRVEVELDLVLVPAPRGAAAR